MNTVLLTSWDVVSGAAVGLAVAFACQLVVFLLEDWRRKARLKEEEEAERRAREKGGKP